MDAMEKIMSVFVLGMLLILGIFIIGSLVLWNRQLSIQERETELKAEQYPYENKVSLEVKTP